MRWNIFLFYILAYNKIITHNKVKPNFKGTLIKNTTLPQLLIKKNI